MPWAKLKNDGGDEERAAHRDDPAGARIRALQPARHDGRDAADDRDPEQPARLPAHRLVQEADGPGGTAERAAAAECLRAARLPVDAAKPVVAEDQRPDAVVARAGDPRPVG